MTTEGTIFQIKINGDEYDLGSNADQIQITWTENGTTKRCTLQDFFNNWQNFKENNAFVYYGTEDPTEQESIKVWYDTATVTSNG